MKKQKESEEVVLTNAYSLFVYAIRTRITRDYYLRRLRTFFDFITLLPNSRIENRCNRFASIAIKDHNWTFGKIVGFLQFQKRRVEREEITAATLYNFVKAIKLFCEMSDVPISWKKITRGLPKVRRFADAIMAHIREIVFTEHRPFCYKDLQEFDINGKTYKLHTQLFVIKYANSKRKES